VYKDLLNILRPATGVATHRASFPFPRAHTAVVLRCFIVLKYYILFAKRNFEANHKCSTASKLGGKQ